MGKISSNKTINGTYGTVWLEGEKLAELESLESKVAIAMEDVNMAGDPATHQKMTGWSGDGTLVLKKVYSVGAKLLGEKVKKGIMPVVKIVSKLADPDSFGAERVALKEVTFTEFILAKIAQKELMKEELPFKFADYELIDLIER